MKEKLTGFLLMVLAAIGLASATILMKIIPQETSLAPSHVSIWRFAIAGALFWIVSVFRPSKGRYQKTELVRYLVLGGVFGISSFTAVFALDNLPSSIYIIILYIYPSLVVIYSLLVGKSVPSLFWLGLPLTFVGLFLTVFNIGSFLFVDPLGFGITVINALAMGSYLVLSERTFSRSGPKLHGTRWMLTGAMFFNLLWTPVLGIKMPGSALGWLMIVSLGIFGTLVPLLLINIGLQLIGAARGSVIITLQPVLAVLFSTLFLGETLTLQQWLGGGLVIAAVILIQLSADRQVRVGEQGAQ